MQPEVVRFDAVEYDEARAQACGGRHDRLQTRPYDLGKSVHLFPEAEDVFADSIARHAEHLDPLVSIDLACVSPELAGWVHVVLPKEPDLVGEYTQSFHNEYVSPNWISFSVTEDRYQFLGDFRFFVLANDPLPELPASYLNDWEQNRPLQRTSYGDAKQRYRDSGWDSFRSQRPHSDDNDGPLYQFKERAWQTNWEVAPPPPKAFRVTLSESGSSDLWAGVSTADGRDLVFVASVQPGRYRDDSYSGPFQTVLFYDPVESIAVQTFDW